MSNNTKVCILFVLVFWNTKNLRKASAPAEEYMKFALENPHNPQNNKVYVYENEGKVPRILMFSISWR